MPAAAPPPRRARTRALAAAAAGLLALAAAAPAAAQPSDGTPLHSGQAVEGRLPLRGAPYVTYTVAVAPGSARLDLELEASGDADLYVKAGGPIVSSWEDECTAYANSPAARERLVLGAGGPTPLEATTYWIDVVQGDPEGPPVTFTLRATVVPAGEGEGPLGPLDPAPRGADPRLGDELPVHGHVSADASLPLVFRPGEEEYFTYTVDVGPDVAALDVSVAGARANTELFLRYARPMEAWVEADVRCTTPDADEAVRLTRQDVPRLRTGRWWVDVVLLEPVERDVTCTLQVRYTRGHDGSDLLPAALPAAAGPGEELVLAGRVQRDSAWTVHLDPEGPDHVTYRVDVPARARSLLVQALGAQQDVDLFLHPRVPVADPYADAEVRSAGSRRDEQLHLDAESEPPLAPGAWYLTVARTDATSPTGPIELVVWFDVPPPAELPMSRAPLVPLALGARTPLVLHRGAPHEQAAARFSFTVPPGARSLHVRVLRADRDLDLFLRRDAVVTDWDDPAGHDWRSASMRLHERLDVDRASRPPLAPGTYYLDVADLLHEDADVDAVLAVTVDRPPVPAADDLVFPPYAAERPLSDLERALQATVHVSGRDSTGSGTCLTPSGLILTNYHVLGEGRPLPPDDVYVSFPRGLDEPPLEVFVAEVVEADPDLDLVLLRITRDALDRPLPADLALPHVALGDSRALGLGAPLWVAGYPSVGGEESRSSMTVTRGVVGGFGRERGARAWLKTDARINAGNSGGTALDERLRLVGVPTQLLTLEGDQIGYCRPVEVLPAAWVRRVADELARRR